MNKIIVLIDDTSEQEEVLNNLASQLKQSEGINSLQLFINPTSREYLNENYDPDLNQLIRKLREKLVQLNPSLIIVDQFYSETDYTGLDVISEIRNIPKFKNCPIFLISGKRIDVVRDIFNTRNVPDHEKVNKLAKIISLRIDKFLDKEFKSHAIEILKKHNIKDVLPSKLRQFEDDPNAYINKLSPRLSKLSFSDFADMIQNDHPECHIILGEMFDLTLSHYLEINEKL